MGPTCSCTASVRVGPAYDKHGGRACYSGRAAACGRMAQRMCVTLFLGMIFLNQPAPSEGRFASVTRRGAGGGGRVFGGEDENPGPAAQAAGAPGPRGGPPGGGGRGG